MVVGNSTHKIFMRFVHGKEIHTTPINLETKEYAVYRWKFSLGLIVKDFPKFQAPYDNMILGTGSYCIPWVRMRPHQLYIYYIYCVKFRMGENRGFLECALPRNTPFNKQIVSTLRIKDD